MKVQLLHQQLTNISIPQDIYTDHAVDIINTHEQTNPLFMWLSYQAPHFPLQVSKIGEMLKQTKV